jgi:hypothetical protein
MSGSLAENGRGTNTADLNKAGPFCLKRRRSLAYTIHAEGGNQYRACQGRALVLCDDDARLQHKSS